MNLIEKKLYISFYYPQKHWNKLIQGLIRPFISQVETKGGYLKTIIYFSEYRGSYVGLILISYDLILLEYGNTAIEKANFFFKKNRAQYPKKSTQSPPLFKDFPCNSIHFNICQPILKYEPCDRGFQIYEFITRIATNHLYVSKLTTDALFLHYITMHTLAFKALLHTTSNLCEADLSHSILTLTKKYNAEKSSIVAIKENITCLLEIFSFMLSNQDAFNSIEYYFIEWFELITSLFKERKVYNPSNKQLYENYQIICNALTWQLGINVEISNEITLLLNQIGICQKYC